MSYNSPVTTALSYGLAGSYHSGQTLALVKQQLDENDSLELYPRHAGE